MQEKVEKKNDPKTIIVVFPSLFSLNKIDYLMRSISKILKIRGHKFTNLHKDGSIITLEADDPVLTSSSIGYLFGIDRIAIARKVVSKFEEVIPVITETGMNLLLKGKKFYIKVKGKTRDYLAKDLELAATSALTERSVGIHATPGSESFHDKTLYTYLTDSYAYVCIFTDKGLGGLPYNSQDSRILCPIHDELSAIASLQSIRMGFDTRLLVCYSNDSDLLTLAKIVYRILPTLPEEEIQLDFCKVSRTTNMLDKISMVTELACSVASDQKIPRIGLPILPLVFPVWFVEQNERMVLQKKLIPWLPLAGIDSSILEDAKELGLEKYLTKLEDLCRTKFSRTRKPFAKKDLASSSKIKTVSIVLGPNSLHDIIDMVKTNQ